MTAVLRTMRECDLDDVLAVQEPGSVLALGSIFPQDTHPFPRAELHARWGKEVRDPTIDCLVVELSGAVVGFVALRGEELLHFGIAVEQWGTGVARTAHDEALERLRRRGIGTARLRVFTGNERARRFYARLGWRSTGERTSTTFPPYPELLSYELDL